MAVRTVYLDPWQPPRFREQPAGAVMVRGSGVEEDGPPDRIGSITVMVSPPGQIVAGQPVRFTAVRMGGSAPLSYQWYGPGDVLIPGATGSTYTFTPNSVTQSGTYTCRVTSAGATDSPQSGGATIVVNPPLVAFAWLMEDAGFILTEDGGRFLLES